MWRRGPCASRRRRPLRDQLRPDDRHVARGVDPQPHLPPLQPHDRDADVVTDEEFFHQLPGQHEHV